MRLDQNKMLLRQGRIGTRAHGVIMHKSGNRARPPRQQQNTVGEIDGLLQIMRDENRGGAGLDEDALQLIAQEQSHLVVERRERFVEKQNFRFDAKSAHDRDKLLLST